MDEVEVDGLTQSTETNMMLWTTGMTPELMVVAISLVAVVVVGLLPRFRQGWLADTDDQSPLWWNQPKGAMVSAIVLLVLALVGMAFCPAAGMWLLAGLILPGAVWRLMRHPVWCSAIVLGAVLWAFQTPAAILEKDAILFPVWMMVGMLLHPARALGHAGALYSLNATAPCQYSSPWTAPWAVILPAMVWLASIQWFTLLDSAGDYTPWVAVALSVAILVQMLMSILTTVKPDLPLKPVQIDMLAVIVTAVIIAVLDQTRWMMTQGTVLIMFCVMTAGFIGAALNELPLFKGKSPNTSDSVSALPQAIIALALIAVVVLASSRLFEAAAYAVSAAAMLIVARTPAARIAVLFLVGRLLLEVFQYQYNSNVTGINLMHPYVSAAVFAGIAMVAVIPGALSHFLSAPASWSRVWMPMAVVVSATVAIGGTMFFLHAEPTGGLLIATLMGALAITPLTTSFALGWSREAMESELPLTPMWVALWMVTLGGVLAPWLEAGSDLERMTRLWWLLGTAVVLGALVMVASWQRQHIEGGSGNSGGGEAPASA